MWRVTIAVISVLLLMSIVVYYDSLELTLIQSLQVIAFGIIDIVFLIWVGEMVYLATGWMPYGWLHPSLFGWLAGFYATSRAIENLSNGLPFFYH